jgi:uncharacterized protein (DUF2267 family)
MSEPRIIDRSAEQAHIWLRELATELGAEDHRAAYRALRAVLHTTRDRLTVEESAQLAAQLPTMVRGIYYEGWKPSRVPARYHDVDSFLASVRDEGMLAGETEASVAVGAVAQLLRRHVSEGEIDDVLAVLPESLRPLLAQSGRGG